jgi:hypothetical protein
MDGWMLVTAFTKVRDAAGNYDSYGFVSTTFAEDEGRRRRKRRARKLDLRLV